jgi:hypothetical protein
MQNNIAPQSAEDMEARDASFVEMIELAFKAIRGVGQGESARSLLWVAVIDILLSLLRDPELSSESPRTPSPFPPPMPHSEPSPAPSEAPPRGDRDERAASHVLLEEDDSDSDSGSDPSDESDSGSGMGEADILEGPWSRKSGWSQRENLVYADDLATCSSSLADQQRKADLISAFMSFAGLELSPGK